MPELPNDGTLVLLPVVVFDWPQMGVALAQVVLDETGMIVSVVLAQIWNVPELVLPKFQYRI
jgi:hypothetical protein